MTAAPLSGLHVLDFSLNLPGPYATYLLSSLGAEVVKVEPPRGDPARHMGRFFDTINRGKKSVVLDLRAPDTRPALDALIRWADVLLEGFRPGVMARLGADWDRAKAINPDLIYCSISAFGQTGPRVDQPGHDLNLQALAGVCWLERDDHDKPRGSVVPVADLSSSLVAVASITAALASREDGPRGRYLDVGMSDAVLSWVDLWGRGLDLTAQARAAMKNAPGERALRPLSAPLLRGLDRRKLYSMPQYGIYRTRDGRYVALGIVDERSFWESLCDVLGLRRLKSLPMGARTALGPVLRRVVGRRIRRRDSAELLAALEAADVPATRVLRPDETPDEAQFQARDFFDERGFVRAPLPGADHLHGEAPALGEHTDEVLRALGVAPA